VLRIWEKLGELYPDAHCELDFESPFQLAVATILSAQCTDVRVNKVTPALFERYPDPEAMARASQDEVEELVRTTGFFRNKAKNIRGFSQRVVDLHKGEVPQTMEELLECPGVARKTANCVLSNAYGLSVGVVVDTHVLRLGNLLRLTRSRNVAKVEEDLCWRFPQESWPLVSHRLIWHGRRTCIARRPRCGECGLRGDCPGAPE
jgi:endonuclease-3